MRRGIQAPEFISGDSPLSGRKGHSCVPMPLSYMGPTKSPLYSSVTLTFEVYKGVITVPMPKAKIARKTPKGNYSADMVRTYLHEIGRVPLLTHEQEIVYGKQVQKMMILLTEKEELERDKGCELSLKEWADHVQLSEIELNRIIKQGQRAKQKMIEANLRLVISIAKNHCAGNWAL